VGGLQGGGEPPFLFTFSRNRPPRFRCRQRTGRGRHPGWGVAKEGGKGARAACYRRNYPKGKGLTARPPLIPAGTFLPSTRPRAGLWAGLRGWAAGLQIWGRQGGQAPPAHTRGTRRGGDLGRPALRDDFSAGIEARGISVGHRRMVEEKPVGGIWGNQGGLRLGRGRGTLGPGAQGLALDLRSGLGCRTPEGHGGGPRPPRFRMRRLACPGLGDRAGGRDGDAPCFSAARQASKGHRLGRGPGGAFSCKGGPFGARRRFEIADAGARGAPRARPSHRSRGSRRGGPGALPVGGDDVVEGGDGCS